MFNATFADEKLNASDLKGTDRLRTCRRGSGGHGSDDPLMRWIGQADPCGRDHRGTGGRVIGRVHDQTEELDDLVAEITVDCYDDDEALMGFEAAFDEQVRFPVSGRVVGEDVQVVSVGLGDRRRELVATCERTGCRYDIALHDVDCGMPRPRGSSAHTAGGSGHESAASYRLEGALGGRLRCSARPAAGESTDTARSIRMVVRVIRVGGRFLDVAQRRPASSAAVIWRA